MGKANAAVVAGNAGTSGKASKGKGNAAPPAPVPTPQPAPVLLPVVQRQTVTLAGQAYSVCGLLRCMGFMGYTAKAGALALAALGVPASGSTVSCQVGAGRQYGRGVPNPHHTGACGALPAPQAAALAALVVGVAPNTAPLGPPNSPHPVGTPGNPTPPAPAPAKPRKGGKAK